MYYFLDLILNFLDICVVLFFGDVYIIGNLGIWCFYRVNYLFGYVY